MRSALLVHSALALCLLAVAQARQPPVARTPLGQYKGRYVTTLGSRQIAAFNGIRYARPPTRFERAEMVEPHHGVYQATQDAHDCLQFNHNYNKYPPTVTNTTVGQEDCLFLNVYTPNVEPNKLYPVMVWIHGGGFMIGTGASAWHGPEFLLDKDVVLVTLNYRLGIFGFLALDSDVLPGNLGLKDQSLALHWVRDNIAGFGGDPASVTLFGESAGGAAVHLQMHSQWSKGLIHRAISQSGTMDCPWAIQPRSEAKKAALDVAEYVGCTGYSRQIMDCLQDKPSEKIMDAVLATKKSKVAMDMAFIPVLETSDDGFITDKDLRMRSTIPWIGGVTTGEGLIMYLELAMAGDSDLSEFNRSYMEQMPSILKYGSDPRRDKMTALIKQRYLGDADFSLHNIQQVVNLMSDGLFVKGHLESARRHDGPSYLYLLTHRGQRSFLPPQINNLNAGVSHGDDLFYLFPATKVYPKMEFNDEDLKVMKLMVDLWTNFAIHGNPTPDKSGQEWYESEDGKLYVSISAGGLELNKHLLAQRMSFWDTMPQLFDHRHQSLRDEL